MKWVVQQIPWALLVPRVRYARGVRVFLFVPEIRSEVNEAAFWGMVGVLFYVVTAPLWVPFLALVFIGDWLTNIGGGWLPDFSSKRRDAIQRAWEKVPLTEIQRRIGDPQMSILTKKENRK